MKAVVWTDAFQAIIMVAGMLTVIIVVRFEKPTFFRTDFLFFYIDHSRINQI